MGDGHVHNRTLSEDGVAAVRTASVATAPMLQLRLHRYHQLMEDICHDMYIDGIERS
jgi:hypothetical protein